MGKVNRGEDMGTLKENESKARWRPALVVGLAGVGVLLAGLLLWRGDSPGRVDGQGAAGQVTQGMAAAGQDAGSPQAKGAAPRLHVVLHRGKEPPRLADGATFMEGDTLELLYSSPTPAWTLVVLCDDQGNVKQLFPSVPAEQLPLASRAPLPARTVLGPNKGREWIVAYFGERTLPAVELVKDLREMVRTGIAEPVPPVPAGVQAHVTPIVRANP